MATKTNVFKGKDGNNCLYFHNFTITVFSHYRHMIYNNNNTYTHFYRCLFLKWLKKFTQNFT